MTEPLQTDQPGQLLIALQRLVAERAAADVDLAAAFHAQKEAAQRQYQESRQQAVERHQRERTETQAEYAAMRARSSPGSRPTTARRRTSTTGIRSDIVLRTGEAEIASRKRLQDARWQAGAVFEAAKQSLDARLKESAAQLDAQEQEFLAVRHEAVGIVRRRQASATTPSPQVAGSPFQGDAIRRRAEWIAAAQNQLHALQNAVRGAGISKGAGRWGSSP